MTHLVDLSLTLFAASLLASTISAEDNCSGCSDSVSSNFNAVGLYVATGPLGSSMRVEITHREGGICDPDCTVEKICTFSLDYKIEFGANGIAWERTDSVRSDSGQTWANQGVERIAPGSGFEVEESIGPIDVSCGFQWLYWFKLWFDQTVAPGTSTPNLWSVGPVSVLCSACE